MRLPTNNVALSAVGFAVVVVLVPLLMVLLYALKSWKARADPLEERSEAQAAAVNSAPGG